MTCERSESAPERRIALYKSNHHHHHHHHHHHKGQARPFKTGTRGHVEKPVAGWIISVTRGGVQTLRKAHTRCSLTLSEVFRVLIAFLGRFPSVRLIDDSNHDHLRLSSADPLYLLGNGKGGKRAHATRV